MEKTGVVTLIGGLCLILALVAIPFTACTPEEVTPTPEEPTPTPEEPTPEVVEWRMNCGPEGSAGFGVGTGTAGFLNKQIAGLQLLPISGGTTAAARLLSRGELELQYMNTFAMVDVWQDRGSFAREPLEVKSYQGMWLWTAATFIITKEGTGIKSYDDLVGKTITISDPSSGLYSPTRVSLEALGLWDKVEVKDMSDMEQGSALKTGIVDAVQGCVMGQASPSRHFQNTDMYVRDLRALTMTKEQQEIINKTLGLSFISVPTEAGCTQDVGMEGIPAFGFWYGWVFHPSTDSDLVYEFVKTCFENTPELLKISPMFGQFAADPKGVSKIGLGSCAGVPVHPGAAKYYKEIGVWDEAWVEGKS